MALLFVAGNGEAAGALFPGLSFRTLPFFPGSVAVADLDGDTVPDLVTTSLLSPVVNVLLGNGEGSFQSAVPADNRPGSLRSSLAVADLDSDGVPDLVTANNETDDVSVLLGNGDGSFRALADFVVGNDPRSVAVADLDGDMVSDLVTANERGGDVSVLLGNGDGTFQPAAAFAVGDGPRSVAVADLDGDGVPDLVTANRGSDDVSVLLGNGDGTFPAQTQLRFGVGSFPDSVVVADLDGDGVPDLVTANSGSADVSVLLGNGDGSFQAAVAFPAGGSSVVAFVAVADLNGDGVPDLVTNNPRYPGGSVLLGNGDGTFPAETQLRFGAGANPASVAVADLDGEGVPDLVTANRGSDDVNVLLGNGDGTFPVQTQLRFGVGSFPDSVAVADLDGDGVPDLVTANRGSDDVSVLLGNGDGTFPAQTQLRFGVGSFPDSVVVADLDRDGVPDLVIGQFAGVSVLLGNGDGSFQAAVDFPTGVFPSVAVADLDGDGVPDLITANRGNDDVSVLLGNGDGSFRALADFVVGNDPEAVAVADLDGDGVPDLITADGSFVSVLLGNGDGTFQAAVNFPAGGGSVAVADLDGDGIPDLVTIGSSGGRFSLGDVSVLLGNGDGTFQSQLLFNAGPGANSVTAADLDGDGVSDLVTANRFGNDVSVLLGRRDRAPLIVAIDVRPGNDRNPINPLSRGVVPVGLLGSPTFDVEDVDATTLAFGPGKAPVAHRNGPHAADVNSDGIKDLLVHFRIRGTGIASEDTEICLTGETLEGRPFEGCDSVTTLPSHGRAAGRGSP